MDTLGLDIPLVSAGRYERPRRAGQWLPLVYGAMHLGGEGGLWPAVCIDTAAHVYALAGHALLSLEAGNQIRLYDREDNPIPEADYTLNPAHDYQGRGVIATATFAAEAKDKEPITVRAAGKAGATGELIQNPLEVVRDLLVEVCGLAPESIEPSAYSRAWARAQELGYRAAGVIDRPQPAGRRVTAILGEFLGSWWQGADGRYKFFLDLGPGAAGEGEGELAYCFREEHLSSVTASAHLRELCNQVGARYAYSPRLKDCETGPEDTLAQDPASIGLYGLRPRTLELKWVREGEVARTICTRLVELLARPRRVITCQEDALAGLVLEKGDLALLSLSWLYDAAGQTLVNQIVRVMSIEPQLDRGLVRYTLLDTGYYKTLAYPADGSLLADGGHQAGGEKDTREY